MNCPIASYRALYRASKRDTALIVSGIINGRSLGGLITLQSGAPLPSAALLRADGRHVGKDPVERILRREGLKVSENQKPRGWLCWSTAPICDCDLTILIGPGIFEPKEVLVFDQNLT